LLGLSTPIRASSRIQVPNATKSIIPQKGNLINEEAKNNGLSDSVSDIGDNASRAGWRQRGDEEILRQSGRNTSSTSQTKRAAQSDEQMEQRPAIKRDGDTDATAASKQMVEEQGSGDNEIIGENFITKQSPEPKSDLNVKMDLAPNVRDLSKITTDEISADLDYLANKHPEMFKKPSDVFKLVREIKNEPTHFFNNNRLDYALVAKRLNGKKIGKLAIDKESGEVKHATKVKEKDIKRLDRISRENSKNTGIIQTFIQPGSKSNSELRLPNEIIPKQIQEEYKKLVNEYDVDKFLSDRENVLSKDARHGKSRITDRTIESNDGVGGWEYKLNPAGYEKNYKADFLTTKADVAKIRAGKMDEATFNKLKSDLKSSDALGYGYKKWSEYADMEDFEREFGSLYNPKGGININANSHIASGLVGGTLNSIDEDGNFNPEKFAAGFIAGLVGSKAVAIAARKMTPQLYNKILGVAKKMPQMANANPRLLGKLYSNGKDVSLNSFAGEKAITANVGKLDTAKAMLEKGADEVEIWQKTGWFKDKDGAWKFEIGDSKARLNPNFESGGKLGELLEHEELFKAYPELKDVTVVKIGDEIPSKAAQSVNDTAPLSRGGVLQMGAGGEASARKGELGSSAEMNAVQKEKRGIYNVAFNNKRSTIIHKDLAAIDEIIKFEKGEADYVARGERKSGYGALHIKKHLDTQNNGWVSKQEYLNMGQMLRKSTMQEDGNKRVYTFFNDDGVRFRVVVGIGKNKERVISFYSNRKPLKAGLSYNSQNYDGNLPLSNDIIAHNETKGYYDPNKKEIGLSDLNDKSTLMHEVQHAIQEIEGFASGGNMAKARSYLLGEEGQKYEQELKGIDKTLSNLSLEAQHMRMRYGEIPQEVREYEDAKELFRAIENREKAYMELSVLRDDLYKKLFEIDKKIRLQDIRETYRKIHGEAEARNVESRLNLDGKAHPHETFDVNTNETIVSKEGGINLSHELEKKYILKDGNINEATVRKEAEPFIEKEYSLENFKAEFPNGKVDTPIGEVSIESRQFNKLKFKGRENFLGLIKPTLERPAFVVDFEDTTFFFKPFRDKDGVVKFASVIKERDGGLDVVSNYPMKNRKFELITREGKVRYVQGSAAKSPIEHSLDNTVRSSGGLKPIEHSSDGKGIIQQNEEKIYHSRKIEEIKREHPNVEKELDDSIVAMRKESFNDINFKNSLLKNIDDFIAQTKGHHVSVDFREDLASMQSLVTQELGKSVNLSYKQLAVLKNDIKNADFKAISDSKIYFDKIGKDGDKKRFFIDMAEDGNVRVDAYAKSKIDNIPIKESALQELAGVGDRARLKNMSFEVKAAYHNELDPIKKEAILKTAEYNALKKEMRGIYNVTYNNKAATLIKRDLDDISSAIAYERGSKEIGAKHVRIRHLAGESKIGYVKDTELLNLGESIRDFVKKYKEPFVDARGARIYEWADKEGTRFRVVVDNRRGNGQTPPPASDNIITFYSDRNLNDKMEFLDPRVRAEAKFEDFKAKNLDENGNIKDGLSLC
jgi:hypothetical protein